MTTRWKTAMAVTRTLATHRVTYRFLSLLLVTIGVSQGDPLRMSLAFYLVAVSSDPAVVLAGAASDRLAEGRMGK